MRAVCAVVVIILNVLSASPARACEAPPDNTARVVVPFEGRRVPRNATLRLGRASNSLIGVLVDASGSERQLSWQSSQLATVEPPFDDDGLRPGDHTLLLHYEGENADPDDAGRTIRFVVEDRVDDDAVDATVVVTEETLSRAPADFETPCDGDVSWPMTRRTWTVDGGADDDLIGILFRSRFELLEGGVVRLFDDTSWGADEVVAIDFADNRSALEIVEGGCASVPMSAPSVFGLVLLALRRRRRRQVPRRAR